MTAHRLIGTARGCNLYSDPNEHPSELLAWRDGDYIGTIFPQMVMADGGPWFARRRGETARKFDNRHAALAHVVGGCPECTCDSVLCATDDTGDSCLNCGACLHGCPDDVCDMTEGKR
jgi:hypothetical protein